VGRTQPVQLHSRAASVEAAANAGHVKLKMLVTANTKNGLETSHILESAPQTAERL